MTVRERIRILLLALAASECWPDSAFADGVHVADVLILPLLRETTGTDDQTPLQMDVITPKRKTQNVSRSPNLRSRHEVFDIGAVNN